jgi:hypothetical protein
MYCRTTTISRRSTRSSELRCCERWTTPTLQSPGPLRRPSAISKAEQPRTLLRWSLAFCLIFATSTLRQRLERSVIFIRRRTTQRWKEVDWAVEELARYDLDVWRQAGPAVQLALVSVIDRLAGEERNALWPLLHTVWRECLNTELRGISWSADSFTISSGAVPAVDDLKTIRRSMGCLSFTTRRRPQRRNARS